MPSELTTYTLEECLDSLIDYRGKTPRKTEAGIPLITAKVVKGGRIETPNEFIAPEDFDSWMTRGLPMIGDVVLTTEAPLGEVGQIQKLPVALAQRIVTLRGNARVLHNDYLLYALQSGAVQAQLRSRASGTTVVGIKQSELRKVTLDLPPPEVQAAVAGILKALDNRIDLLSQTNATLESIAQALFKSWFIDFDPVRAKAEGRGPEGMDAATAALFPTEFEESARGQIPKGWQIGTVRDVCAIFDSRRVPLSGKERAQMQGPYPYYGAAALMDRVNDFIYDGVYLLLGEDGSVTNADGTPITQYVWGKFWVNNHAHVLQGANGVCTEHLMLALRGLDFTPYVTGAVQAKLNQANLFRVPFLQADPKISEAFASEVATLYKKLRANIEQAMTLETLRDTLLPRLISGKLRLPEAQAEIEEVIA